MDDLSSMFHWLGGFAVNTCEMLAISFIIFTPLAYFSPIRREAWMRDDLFTDILFFFLRVIYFPLQALLIMLFVRGWGHFTHLATWPLWAQIAVMLLAVDFMNYWVHRWSHGKHIWRFHSIHHSSHSVDWMSAARWHPINDAMHIVPQALVGSLGFSSDAFFIVLVIGGFGGQLAHANLNWTYGPLRYVFASPVYHHWHHTHPREGGERNFAQLFSFYDLLFGTFYWPKTGAPIEYGAPYDHVPNNLWGQLCYPFMRKISTQAAGELPPVE